MGMGAEREEGHSLKSATELWKKDTRGLDLKETRESMACCGPQVPLGCLWESKAKGWGGEEGWMTIITALRR